ncbi:TerB family tellurite resistance protein [Massilia sp. CCM 8733]|uniref:TerB family tellurite resistance protein n=1 Tax=Massilia mucilaginosa TaxID=2609282 RepID=A0ABX0NUE0_9BURK|nr:TerB family tellurite resistance protein [Massilia mucilaginosa]NHZ90561.1 TerB family tellurite resistance protein [Massilia mucilaginosa]
MRSYPPDSPQAVSRLLVLCVIADGGGSPLEIAATYRLGILDSAGIQEDVFDQVLREMCTDLPTTPDGLVRVETEMIDQMLAEILRPDLRLSVWKAMWQLSYADDQLADGELALLLKATSAWGIKEGDKGSGPVAARSSVPHPAT